MKRIAGVLALAAMLTLAGCNGILSGDQQNTSNSTVTPVNVPTDQPTQTPAQELTPGITEAGIENFSAVLSAQSNYLSERSFTTNSTTRASAANGTVLYSWNGTYQKGNADGGTLATTGINDAAGSFRSSAIPTRIEAWITPEDTIYQQRSYRNMTPEYTQAEASHELYGVYGGTTLQSTFIYYNESNTQVVQNERNGTPLYIVSGERTNTETGNESIRLTVDQQGFIHEIVIITKNANERGRKYVTRASFSKIGETESHEPPEWFSEAKQQTQPRTSSIPTANTTHLGTSESPTSAATESGNTTIDGLVETTTA